MHAFLFIRANYTNIDEKIKFLGARKIELILKKIDDVRDINSFTKLKLSEKTAIVIQDFDKASDEAQNAFLKSLEEPQEKLVYILTASNTADILPTIVSRCEVVHFSSTENISESDEELIKEFIDSSIGNKLNIISKFTKRENAVRFTKSLIFICHKEGNEDVAKKFKILEEALKLKENLELNGNVQLQLTNFVVQLPKHTSF